MGRGRRGGTKSHEQDHTGPRPEDDTVQGRIAVRRQPPQGVLAADCGERGDLYIRFKHVEKPVGEPTDDGLAVLFYEEDGTRPVAVEIMDLNRLMQDSKVPRDSQREGVLSRGGASSVIRIHQSYQIPYLLHHATEGWRRHLSTAEG